MKKLGLILPPTPPPPNFPLGGMLVHVRVHFFAVTIFCTRVESGDDTKTSLEPADLPTIRSKAASFPGLNALSSDSGRLGKERDFPAELVG